MRENEITGIIIDCAIEVHRTLGGPGLLESVYEEALKWEISTRGLTTETQRPVPILYKNQRLATPLRLDLVVENLVVAECKSVDKYNVIHEVQLLTYLRLTGLKVGLVLNFGHGTMKEGIHRVSNGVASL